MKNSEESLKQQFLQVQKRDLHLKFFEGNSPPSSIQVPIFSITEPASEHITPFRNLGCTKPGCVYDILNLIELTRRLSSSIIQEIYCNSCEKMISLDEFVLDLTLKEIIDEIWKKHDEIASEITIEAIAISKKGTWKPVFMVETSEIPESIKSKFSGDLRIKQSSPSKTSKLKNKQEKPLHFQDFTVEEYRSLFKELQQESHADHEVLFMELGFHINSKDITELYKEDTIGNNIVAIFLNYLINLQHENPTAFIEHSCRSLIISLRITSFGGLKNNVPQYHYLNKLSSKVFEEGGNFVKMYDRVIMMINLSDTWYVSVVDLKTSRLYIIDFLSDELGIDIEKLASVSNQILHRELGIKTHEYETYKGSKLKYISDGGIYSLQYLYKCISSGSVSDIKVKFSEKELFKRQLIWLLLKMRQVRGAPDHIQLKSARIRNKSIAYEEKPPQRHIISESMSPQKRNSSPVPKLNIRTTQDSQMNFPGPPSIEMTHEEAVKKFSHPFAKANALPAIINKQLHPNAMADFTIYSKPQFSQNSPHINNSRDEIMAPINSVPSLGYLQYKRSNYKSKTNESSPSHLVLGKMLDIGEYNKRQFLGNPKEKTYEKIETDSFATKNYPASLLLKNGGSISSNFNKVSETMNPFPGGYSQLSESTQGGSSHYLQRAFMRNNIALNSPSDVIPLRRLITSENHLLTSKNPSGFNLPLLTNNNSPLRRDAKSKTEALNSKELRLESKKTFKYEDFLKGLSKAHEGLVDELQNVSLPSGDHDISSESLDEVDEKLLKALSEKEEKKLLKAAKKKIIKLIKKNESELLKDVEEEVSTKVEDKKKKKKKKVA